MNNSNTRTENPLGSPALLRPPEAAAYLSLCERSLWSLMNSGEIPHVRIGRSVRYAISDLDAYIESQRVSDRRV